MATVGSGGSVTKTDEYAVYFELSPKLVWLVRIVNMITVLMVAISVILCFVQGPKNNAFYLLAVNLFISMLVCLVVNWWYKSGDLGSEKFWFILLICAVIIIQCIGSDIFLYKKESAPSPAVTTPRSTTFFPWTSMGPVTIQTNATRSQLLYQY